jgi:hypothetical protein
MLSLQTDGADVFWTQRGFNDANGNTPARVWRVAKSGGMPSIVFTAPLSIGNGLAANGGYLYFTDSTDTSFDERVLRAKEDTGDLTVLATSQLEPPLVAEYLVVDSDTIYLTQFQWQPSLQIWSVPKAGGSPTLLLQSPAQGAVSAGLAVDDRYVYLANAVISAPPDQPPTSLIEAVPKGGGDDIVLAVDREPTSLAIDAQAVYWGSHTGQILRRCKP